MDAQRGILPVDRQFLGLRGNALTISVTEFIVTSGMFLAQPFFSLYVLSLGASPVELGLLNLTSALFGAVLMVPMGYLSDRIGRKRPVVISGFIAAFGPLVQALAQNWQQLIPGVLLASVLQVVWPIRQSMVADELKPHERVRGFATFFTIVMLPSSVMPLLSGYVLDVAGLEAGMRVILLFYGALSLVASYLRLRFIRQPETGNPVGVKAATPIRLGSIGFLSTAFEPIIKVRSLQVLFLGTCGVMFIFGVMGSFGAVYATEFLKVSKTEWGLISALTGFFSIFMRIPVSKITLRLGEMNALVVSQISRSIYPIAFVHAKNSLQLLALGTGYNAAFSLGSPAYQALITEYTPSQQRGRSYAVFGMMWTTLAQVATLIGGAIWEVYGAAWTFYVAGIFAYGSTTFLCAWLLAGRRKHGKAVLSQR